ncbi:MAG TPA: thioesterase family protein [Acidobacteriota bacterium]|nr:thioesterase family protein [Acidobacteriota bacterium]
MPYRSKRLVEFHHTDSAGICHFASFFLLMESVEHEFLRSLGESVVIHRDGKRISFPRLSASCEYMAPAQFEDVLEAELAVTRLGSKSITYSINFTRGDAVIARGKIACVCCISEPGKRLQSIPIPSDIAGKIAASDAKSDVEADGA